MDWFTQRGIPRAEGDTVLLAIPDIRQAKPHECGAAAVEAVAAFHRVKRVDIAPLANPVQGMGPDTAAAILRALGLRVLTGSMNVEDLRHLTRTGRPVLCPVAQFGGHWVVVRGVERGGVHFHCPIEGPSRLAAADWLAGWRDVSESGQAFHRWGIASFRGGE